jgi:2-oxoglutarate dehydrogenase E1 component
VSLEPDPITSLNELRIWSAWPSIVGASATELDVDAGSNCGGAGWFEPVEAAVNRPELAAVLAELPAPAPCAPPAPAAANPAAAPSPAAIPAVTTVAAAPTNATAVAPTSPLTIRFAINGITAIASE